MDYREGLSPGLFYWDCQMDYEKDNRWITVERLSDVYTEGFQNGSGE